MTGTVLGEELGPKLIVFKFKQKATYRRTRGHRQHLVRVRIDEISAGGKRATAEKAEADKPAKAPSATADKAEAAKPAKATTETKADKPVTPKPAASAKAGATEKPARTRKPAAKAKAEATDAPAKPAPRRRSPAKKAESKE